MTEQRFGSVAEYIASFPPATRTKLRQVRKAILDAVPDAEESISYHMPTYALPGWKLYFSGYKAHVSLHGDVEVARAALAKRMAPYQASGRGTLQFPLDEPMPTDLVADIAREGRGVAERKPNAKPRPDAKAKAKAKAKTAKTAAKPKKAAKRAAKPRTRKA